MADADSGAELATYSWRLLRGEVILMGSGREFRRSFIPDFRRQTWEIADDAHATPRTEQVTHWLIADRRGRLVVQFVQPTARAGPSVRTMLKARLHTSTDDADLPLLLVFGGFLLL
jgi:hypothetical protein